MSQGLLSHSPVQRSIRQGGSEREREGGGERERSATLSFIRYKLGYNTSDGKRLMKFFPLFFKPPNKL